MTEVEYCLGIPDPVQRKAVISALSPAGFHCMGEGKDCAQFLEVIHKIQPQLAILELSLPGNVLETASIIDQETSIPVLLLEHRNLEGSCLRNDHFMILPLPVDSLVLNYVVEVLLLEYTRRRKLQQELRELRAKIQSRVIIERAKGVIMKNLSLSEQQAYRLLQKKSMDLRLPIKTVAEAVIKQDFSL